MDNGPPSRLPNPGIRGMNNALTSARGVIDGLVKGGLMDEKAQVEGKLKAWVDADAGRNAAYGDVLEKLAALATERRKTRDQDIALREISGMATLRRSAGGIVRMAEERPKPDAEREEAFQERNWQRHEQGEMTGQKFYDQKMDKALFKLALKRAARVPEKERSAAVAAVLGKGKVTDAGIDTALDALYKTTTLEDADARVKLLKTAKIEGA